jgi:hypothetical protein
MVPRYRQILGWLAVGLSTLAACFWAFWGIIENFHEGWYHPSLGMNLVLMVVQYLFAMLVFVGAALVAIRWPRAGGSLHLAAALYAAWRFHGASPVVVYGSIVGPLVFVGIAYWVGRPRPRRWAFAAVVGCPLVTLVACGTEPVYRVSGRWDDGDRGTRLVRGNDVLLVWAPRGPGWPDDGVTWHEAVRRCRFLTADGVSLADTPQDVWRLPTVEEVVRSSCRHGRNAGGRWDAGPGGARFDIMPDKEAPLWDVHSKVIYWWTSTEVGPDGALRISYNGHVMALPKRVGYGYLGFRAVKEPVPAKGE